MKTFKRTIIGMMATFMLILGMSVFASPLQVSAACNTTTGNPDKVTNGAKQGQECALGTGQQQGLKGSIEIVTNTLLFLIGAVSVIMIIVGGIRYVLSNGDSGQITSAKNTILYAVIGLIVALLSYAIVAFILNAFVQPDAAAVPAS